MNDLLYHCVAPTLVFTKIPENIATPTCTPCTDNIDLCLHCIHALAKTRPQDEVNKRRKILKQSWDHKLALNYNVSSRC